MCGCTFDRAGYSAYTADREDPRNTNGGAWTFRVSKDKSHEFWKEILMMAIGEILQDVVEKGELGVIYILLLNRADKL